MSCPQACIHPLLDAKSRPLSSLIGRASMSPRIRKTFPSFFPPTVAIIPAFPQRTGLYPILINSVSTNFKVFVTSNPVSGFICKYLRLSIIS